MPWQDYSTKFNSFDLFLIIRDLTHTSLVCRNDGRYDIILRHSASYFLLVYSKCYYSIETSNTFWYRSYFVSILYGLSSTNKTQSFNNISQTLNGFDLLLLEVNVLLTVYFSAMSLRLEKGSDHLELEVQTILSSLTWLPRSSFYFLPRKRVLLTTETPLQPQAKFSCFQNLVMELIKVTFKNCHYVIFGIIFPGTYLGWCFFMHLFTSLPVMKLKKKKNLT